MVVALSGGLDSVVLLHLLRFPLRDLDLRLSAAHLDHGMRPGSAADAAWTRGLCRAWGVPLTTERLARPPRSEAEARRARYRYLERTAPPAALIATAHHRDDQAETVLFRAIRGTGVRGLRGIAPRRGRVVRPLLPFGRAALEEHARTHGLSPREDPTNRDTSFARNRIRHETLPALEAIRPGATRSLARLAERARVSEAAWEAALEALERAAVIAEDPSGVTLARPVLHSYHPELRARLLRRVLRRYGSTPDRAGTHAALEFISSGPSGGEFHVRGNLRLERDFDRIRVGPVARPGDGPADVPLVIRDAGSGRGEALVGGRRVTVRWGTEGSAGAGERAVVRDPRFPVTIRARAPGDRIRLGYGSKPVKKLMSERRVGREERRSTPVVADGGGRILWVVGIARAEGVAEQGRGFEITVEHG